MHKLSSSFVLGYHGCDKKVAEDLLAGKNFKPSNNDYDWLGPGMYFWEANPLRGVEFAEEARLLNRGSKIDAPTVIGAVIDLGLCLDMTTSAGVQQIKDSYDELKQIAEKAEYPLPKNKSGSLMHRLDCAVIKFFHEVRDQSNEPQVDTVRGVFVEGSPIFDSSGFYQKTHIQICVSNPDNIKGVFRVPKHQML